MMEIPLRGKYRDMAVLVDDGDFEIANQHGWIYHKIKNVIYARRDFTIQGKRRRQYLHSFLTGWERVDHVNHDGLDNRRLNLRPVTHTQNMRNTRPCRTRVGTPCASSFKGVSLETRRGHWVAHINVDGQHIYLGSFGDEQQAALAYDHAALRHFGEFACTNFNQEGSSE